MAHNWLHGWKHAWKHGAKHGGALTLGSYAPVEAGPGLVVIAGQSNAGGIGVAASMTDFPAVTSSFANFQLSRRGATAGASPTWITEAKQALQPRTAAIGVAFPVGSGGMELQMGRVLDAANSTQWAGALHFLDGSGLEDHWLNPTYPSGQPQMITQLFTEIDAQIAANAKPLKCFVWIQGEADANGTPDFTNYYNNLTTLFDRVRTRYGDIGIVIVRLINKFSSGGTNEVRTNIESFGLANSRCRIVYTDDLSLRDTAHYADDAGGVLGYCELGNRVAAAVLSAVNNTRPTEPRWGALGYITTGTSGSALGPVQLPPSFGSENSKKDIGLLIVSGLGTNNYLAPSGWTEVTGSPQWNSGSSLNARLHVFMRTLTPGDPTPTVADVAGDDSKLGAIAIIRNSSGLDVNPAGSNIGVGDTAVSWPSVTTVTDNCLIVHIMAHRTDIATSQCSGYTNAALTNLTEQVDMCTTSGLGYGIVVATGTKATAGAVGNTTATLASAVTQARITLAFKV